MPRVRRDAGEHQRHRDVQRHCDRQRQQHRARQVALRVFRLFRRRGQRVVAEHREKHHAGAGQHALPAEVAKPGRGIGTMRAGMNGCQFAVLM